MNLLLDAPKLTADDLKVITWWVRNEPLIPSQFEKVTDVALFDKKWLHLKALDYMSNLRSLRNPHRSLLEIIQKSLTYPTYVKLFGEYGEYNEDQPAASSLPHYRVHDDEHGLR